MRLSPLSKVASTEIRAGSVTTANARMLAEDVGFVGVVSTHIFCRRLLPLWARPHVYQVLQHLCGFLGLARHYRSPGAHQRASPIRVP